MGKGAKPNPQPTQQYGVSSVQYHDALRNAYTPSPEEQAMRQNALSTLNFLNTPGADPRELPGLAAFFNVDQLAQQREQEEIMGNRGYNLAGPGNQQVVALNKQLAGMRRGQQFGSDLNQLLESRRAGAEQTAMGLAPLSLNRSTNILGTTAGREANYLNYFGQKQQQQGGGVWGGIAKGIATAALNRI
jgi:hypothetical protein